MRRMAACIASILDSGGMPLKGGKMDKINASDLSVHEFSFHKYYLSCDIACNHFNWYGT